MDQFAWVPQPKQYNERLKIGIQRFLNYDNEYFQGVLVVCGF